MITSYIQLYYEMKFCFCNNVLLSYEKVKLNCEMTRIKENYYNLNVCI